MTSNYGFGEGGFKPGGFKRGGFGESNVNADVRELAARYKKASERAEENLLASQLLNQKENIQVAEPSPEEKTRMTNEEIRDILLHNVSTDQSMADASVEITNNPDQPQNFRPISGLLGNILKPFEILDERVIQPGAALLTDTVQRVVPGGQQVQMKTDEYRDQGMGFLEARTKAYQETDLPSMRLDIIPGGGIPLPGGRKLDKIDIGVKGALELVADPLNLAFGAGVYVKGTGRVGKLIQRGIIPSGISQTRLWAKGMKGASDAEKLEASRAAARIAEQISVGDFSSVVTTPTGSQIARRMLEKSESVAHKESIGARLAALKTRFEEVVTDRWSAVNAATARARNAKRENGLNLPVEENAEIQVHLMTAGHDAGKIAADKVIKSAMRILKGAKVESQTLSNYLKLHHAKDVLNRYPDRDVPKELSVAIDAMFDSSDVKNIKTASQRRDLLDDTIRAIEHGHEGAKVQKAARIITNGYNGFDAKLRLRPVSEAESHFVSEADGILEMQRKAGILSSKQVDQLRELYPNYIPTRYLDEWDQALTRGDNFPNSGSQANLSSDDLQHMAEQGMELFTQDPLSLVNASHVRSQLLIRRNMAAKAIIHTLRAGGDNTLRRLREGEKARRGESTLTYMSMGEPQTFVVPADIAREAQDISKLMANPAAIETWGRALNSVPRSLLINYNPAFIAANFVFDMMTVMVTKNIMPWSVLNAARKNMVAGLREDTVWNDMLSAGAAPSGYWGQDPRFAVKNIEKAGNVAFRTEKDWGKYFNPVRLPGTAVSAVRGSMRLWNDIGHRLELAPRRAVFEAQRKRSAVKGQGKWNQFDIDQDAALHARRATVDFQRGGYGVRALNSWFLFLNPAVQGTILPARALLTGDDKTRALLGLGGLATATAGLHAYNSGFEEYRDIPAYDRLGKMIVMMPSEEKDVRGNTVPHYMAMVPMLREFGALTAPINHIMDRIKNDEPETFAELAKHMAGELSPFPETVTPTFIGETLVELATNKDFFRDRDIVPREFLGKPAAQQFNERTSQVAITLGQWLNYSPMKIDHIMQTGVLQDIAILADNTIRSQLGEDVEAEAIVAQLRDMQELFDADAAEFRRMRALVFSEIGPEMSKRVELAEKKPELYGISAAFGQEVPIATSIVNRFYRKQSGNLYWTNFERAARDMDMDKGELLNVIQRMREGGTEFQKDQQDLDDQFKIGQIGGRQWRELRKDISAKYQGLIMSLGLEYPPAKNFLEDPSVRNDFYKKINNATKLMEDEEDRGKLLYTTFRAIPIPTLGTDTSDPDNPTTALDWQRWFELRDEFRNELTPEEEQMLDDERQLYMTEEERRFDNFISPTDGHARIYWSIPEVVLKDRDLAEEYKKFETFSGEQRMEIAAARPELPAAKPRITALKQALRRQSPDLDRFLYRYGYTKQLLHPDNFGREAELSPFRDLMKQELLSGATVDNESDY